MYVKEHLIPMLLNLPAEDKAYILSALTVDKAGGTGELALLDLPMGSNDANAATIRDYFKALLTKLWEEGAGFSGKHPFGNSGWEHELYFPLVKHGRAGGIITKEDDEDNTVLNEYLEEVMDEEEANTLIFEAINAL